MNSVVAMRPVVPVALLAAVGSDAIALSHEVISHHGHDTGVTLRLRDGTSVAGDIAVNITAPRTGTTKLRMDVTRVNQVAPITLPR